MALQRWGLGGYVPRLEVYASPPAFTALLLDAAADRITYVGRFVHKEPGARTVNGVGFLLGTVTKGNGSTLQCSLQDVDLANGPPYREDGTPDQTQTIANADAGFVTNAWYEGAFDAAATRSLTSGDRVAVVLQFASFVAGDSVQIRALGALSVGLLGESGVATNLSGTYAAATVLPNVVLRCTDGSYGTIEGGWPCSALTTHTLNLNTATADEYAMGLQFPYPVALNGLAANLGLTTATDQTELLLYSATTALTTIVIDHNVLRSASASNVMFAPVPEVVLAANTLYRVSIRPLGTNNMALYSFDVAAVGHFGCHPGDATWHQWTRLDQGAWGGEVTTRRLFAGVRLSAFDDGVSAGGGVPLLGRGLVQ